MVDIGDKTKMSSKLLRPIIVPATYNDYPVIQNMARFYVYDLSRYCGFISEDWSMPANGLYECFDFNRFFITTIFSFVLYFHLQVIAIFLVIIILIIFYYFVHILYHKLFMHWLHYC